MKQILCTTLTLLLLGMPLSTTAQKHRHTPQTELADSVKNNAPQALPDTASASRGGVVVYSDTTSASSTTAVNADNWWDDDEQVKRGIRHIISHADADDVMGMLFVIGILLIVFVIGPVLTLIVIFYFIHKNRKEKMRLAQMAMQQGQPIPEQLLNGKPESVEDEYQQGMRQCFVGVGLMVFLGYAAGHVGFGIGALVFCIGLGKVFASKTARKNQSDRDVCHDDFNNNI